MSKIIFITGGARSGKSRFAEELAAKISSKVLYLATAQARDEEMKLRISRHRERRPHFWQTVEEPLEVHTVLENLNGSSDLVLLDCLTLWLSNLLHQFQGRSQLRAQERLEAAFKSIREKKKTLIVVSNEVGMGLVPDNALARAFSDLQGRVNQFVASKADEMYFLVAGVPVRVK
ncbi:MAG: bifunctional adenosylcobinamide kinase/adenosylcobinamide-phosphate guanylyltransferase [Candidatus Omnitrophica bacterium]|nr:bifunctional adenosylcobinamide kinase/adenosylcobinamide-phosphate guanylyltransferase [Candidatus Omnitrophota bacterium]